MKKVDKKGKSKVDVPMDRETYNKLLYMAEKEGKPVDDVVSDILKYAQEHPEFMEEVIAEIKKNEKV